MRDELTPRARAKRDQIRSAARRLFLQNGYTNTSTDMLAAAAGVSKQTLYSYYPSKEELLTDVLQQLIDALSRDQVRISTGELPLGSRDELRAVLTNLAQHIVTSLMQPDYLALVRIIVAESSRFPHLGKLFRSAVPERVLHNVATVLQQARAQRLTKVDDLDTAARMFVGPLLIDVLLGGLWAAGDPPRHPPSERIERIVALYMNVLTGYVPTSEE